MWDAAIEATPVKEKVGPEGVPVPLRPRVRQVRAVAKWLAVGGASATPFFPPPLGAAVTAAASYFLLVDP